MLQKLLFAVLSLTLVFALAVNLSGCTATVQASDLMDGVKVNDIAAKTADDAFIESQMRLAVELFQASASTDADKNILISPLSVQLALAMTANGADGQTRSEMETLLGGEIPLEALNEYLHSYVSSLPSEEKHKLQIANSIWFRDDDQLTVEEAFLQTNADYYGAQIYKAPFDEGTLQDINSWVGKHTDGMIDTILDQIPQRTVMYLINAMAFDAEWKTPYVQSDIFERTFTDIDGNKTAVEMMSSEESKYLDDGKATGFIKNYSGGKYSFAALLPNEGIPISDYIAGLTAECLLDTLRSAKAGTVTAALPKFTCEYSQSMNEVLSELGMPTAFDGENADFSQLGQTSAGNIYISQVLHKTYISVDTLGTKAGAATKVEMNAMGAIQSEWSVTLNRPFVYMIIDNTTNLPIFIGAVTDIES